MADINVERKSPGIWPWILGLIVLALVVWALAEMMGGDDPEVAMERTDPVATEAAPEPLPQEQPPTTAFAGAGIPVAEIMGQPATWTGRTVEGEVRVVEVPTDRGFWIEDGGERLFVILNDAPEEQPADINAGQTVRLTGATVHDDLADVPGDVDQDTRDIVQSLPAFLTVDQANVVIAQPAG